MYSKCGYDGCTNQCFIDPQTNMPFKYCSKQHGTMDKQQRQPQQRMQLSNEFQKPQTVFPYDVILIENSNGKAATVLKEITLKLKMLIDVIPIEVPSPTNVLEILQSIHARRVLCCISSSVFTIPTSLFPIFHISEPDLILKVANRFREKVETIYFYNNDDLYFHFTNFFELPEQTLYRIGNGLYKSTEHYFQSKKFMNIHQQLQVLQANSPREAFTLARSMNDFKIPNWNVARDSAMREALIAKCSMPEFGFILYFTGNARLVEHTENDNYWADGGFQINGQGKNMLGTMWMELRQQYQLNIISTAQLENFFNASIFFHYSKSMMFKKGIPKEFQQMKAQQLNQLEQFYMSLERMMQQQQQHQMQHQMHQQMQQQQMQLHQQSPLYSAHPSVELMPSEPYPNRKPLPLAPAVVSVPVSGPSPIESTTIPQNKTSPTKSIYPSFDSLLDDTPLKISPAPMCTYCKAKSCLLDQKEFTYTLFCSVVCKKAHDLTLPIRQQQGQSISNNQSFPF